MKAARDSLPTWDLSDLFSGIDDPAIKERFLGIERSAEAFAEHYRGRVKKFARNPKAFLPVLREYEEIAQDNGRLVTYAYLKFAESSDDPKIGAFYQESNKRYVAISQTLTFFELELLALEGKALERLAGAPPLAPLSHYLRTLIQSRPHRLSEDLEKLMSDKDLTGRQAFVRLFDQHLSAKIFTLKEKGKEKKLSEVEVLTLLYSPSRSVRKEAARSLTQGLKEEEKTLAYISNTLADDKRISDKYRKYASPEASRHLANEISQDMVDTMTDVVTANYGIVGDFYRFKAKVLKLKTLTDYDRYAPVASVELRISFPEAKNLILKAFAAFSEPYAAIAQEFFDKKWIDAATRKGKMGGAFCSFATPDLHPYVFMNYKGTVKDVFTLAHELGHAIHAYLMREQTFLNFNVPLTVAETASVFAEMLLFDHLKATLNGKKELFSLYMGKVEGIFATVFRQVAMYRFEQDFHAARRERGELAPREINVLWLKRQREMFRSSVTLTDDYGWWWSYIPHFVHTPFYVYAYAFGELLTLSLYARYESEGSAFTEKYLTFLRTGGSTSPEGQLAPLGIDLRTREFWEEGVALIRGIVKETKRYR